MSLRLVPLALLLGISSALAFDTSKLIEFGSLPLDVLRRSSPSRPDCNRKSIKRSPRATRNNGWSAPECASRVSGKILAAFECHPTPVTSVPNGCKSVPPFVLLTAMAKPLRRSRPRR